MIFPFLFVFFSTTDNFGGTRKGMKDEMMDSFFSRKGERQKDSLTFRKYSQGVDWFEGKKGNTKCCVKHTRTMMPLSSKNHNYVISSSCLVLSAGIISFGKCPLLFEYNKPMMENFKKSKKECSWQY